jgi:hypothetical protein
MNVAKEIPVEPYLYPPPRIPTHNSICEEFAAPKQQTQLSSGRCRLVRKDSVPEEGLRISGEMALHKDRTETAVRKQGRCVFMHTEPVVAVAKIGMHENIENPAPLRARCRIHPF